MERPPDRNYDQRDYTPHAKQKNRLRIQGSLFKLVKRVIFPCALISLPRLYRRISMPSFSLRVFLRPFSARMLSPQLFLRRVALGWLFSSAQPFSSVWLFVLPPVRLLPVRAPRQAASIRGGTPAPARVSKGVRACHESVRVRS